MATQYDLYNDPQPQLLHKKPSAPTIAAMDTALLATGNAAYTQAKLNTLGERDKIYACRLYGLTVVGL